MRAYCPHCNHYGPWRYIGSGQDERGRRWESYRCAWCGAVRVVAVVGSRGGNDGNKN